MQKCQEEQHEDKPEQQLNLFENKVKLSNIKLSGHGDGEWVTPRHV